MLGICDTGHSARLLPTPQDSLVLAVGHSSQGLPQARPSEQQQDARVTPTPISALQEMPPSPRSCVSRKQFPTRVSEQAEGMVSKWQKRNGACVFAHLCV